MRKYWSVALALSIATASPALAGNGNHNGGWNGGHYHSGSHWRWYGNNWIWGTAAGAAVIGEIVIPQYSGFGGYGYAPYYSYPTPLVPPQPRWCQGPYGPYQC